MSKTVIDYEGYTISIWIGKHGKLWFAEAVKQGENTIKCQSTSREAVADEIQWEIDLRVAAKDERVQVSPASVQNWLSK